MSNGQNILEVSSLPDWHPEGGDALLYTYAPSLIVRLSPAPSTQASGTMSREVSVTWRQRGRVEERSVVRHFGWSGLPSEFARVCAQLRRTKNANELTADAAVVAAALLIHDLENG